MGKEEKAQTEKSAAPADAARKMDGTDSKSTVCKDEKKSAGLLSKEGKKHKPLSGARQSKVDPKMQAMLLHEQSRMRIFKIFGIITGVMVILFAAMLIGNHLKQQGKAKKYLDGEYAKMDELSGKIEDANSYEAALYARNGVRIAENVMRYDYKQTPAMKSRIAKYMETLNTSFPSIPQADVKGESFIAKNAMLDMVYIPTGEFYMGRKAEEGGADEEDELPRHKVKITTPFWMARTEVDVWQMRKLIPGYRMEPWAGYRLDKLTQPAGKIKWHTAMLYCQKLTELESAEGRVPEGYEYRLPTEAEWEYACRGGSESVYPWGDKFGDAGAKHANSLDQRSARKFGWKEGPDMAVNDGHYVSSAAGSYPTNGFGLYDMNGNVWEWCFDWYLPNMYKLMPADCQNPVQKGSVATTYTQRRPWDAGTFDIEMPCRVIRGGSWGNLPEDLRSAARNYMPPDEENNGVGFRPVLAPRISTKVRN